MHIYTCIHIYIYIYVCVCVDIYITDLLDSDEVSQKKVDKCTSSDWLSFMIPIVGDENSI